MAHQAFWSRASLIEYGIRFAIHPHAPDERQADPALKDTLKEERSGILAWLMRGCLAWQQQGLAVPSSICLATEKYRDEEDNILHFLTECCVIRPEVSIKASLLYEAYKAWCEENQFGRGMNATLFGNEMSRRFEKKTTKIGRVYQGVGILTAGEGLVKGCTRFFPITQIKATLWAKTRRNPSHPSPAHLLKMCLRHHQKPMQSKIEAIGNPSPTLHPTHHYQKDGRKSSYDTHGIVNGTCSPGGASLGCLRWFAYPGSCRGID